MAANDSDRLVKVAIVDSEVEASILEDALKQEGIPCHLRPHNALQPMGMSLGSSFEIFVFARDEKRARWVIGERP
jgi:hypothetical protein